MEKQSQKNGSKIKIFTCCRNRNQIKHKKTKGLLSLVCPYCINYIGNDQVYVGMSARLHVLLGRLFLRSLPYFLELFHGYKEYWAWVMFGFQQCDLVTFSRKWPGFSSMSLLSCVCFSDSKVSPGLSWTIPQGLLMSYPVSLVCSMLPHSCS